MGPYSKAYLYPGLRESEKTIYKNTLLLVISKVHKDTLAQKPSHSFSILGHYTLNSTKFKRSVNKRPPVQRGSNLGLNNSILETYKNSTLQNYKSKLTLFYKDSNKQNFSHRKTI